MYKYQLTAAAQEDLENIYRFGYQKFGELQADRYFFGLIDCLENIAAHPLLFPTVDYIRPMYRRCAYRSESIYYRLDHDVVVIMAIIGRQDELRRL
jgi:toxin ParE1/3/4